MPKSTANITSESQYVEIENELCILNLIKGNAAVNCAASATNPSPLLNPNPLLGIDDENNIGRLVHRLMHNEMYARKCQQLQF